MSAWRFCMIFSCEMKAKCWKAWVRWVSGGCQSSAAGDPRCVSSLVREVNRPKVVSLSDRARHERDGVDVANGVATVKSHHLRHVCRSWVRGERVW